jgi:protein-S-isoprenylcysteine O-methyltransferase Ste14
MNLIYHWLFPGVWMAFSVYWFGAALWVKRIQRGEPGHKRIFRLILTTLCAGLLISPRFGHGPLGWTILPQSRITFFAGAAMLLAGLGFAIWARVHLGAYWSAMVAVKEGHRLIRTGPYRLVRHPIYSGILTGLAGTAVAEGQLRGLVATALLSAIYYRKSQDEESLLSAEFPDEYPAYRREVGALIPVSGRPQKIFWSAVAAMLLVTLRHALLLVVMFAGLMNLALARAEQPVIAEDVRGEAGALSAGGLEEAGCSVASTPKSERWRRPRAREIA